MIVRARAFICGMESRHDGVSVGWQWASKTPRCQGKNSAEFSSGDGLRISSIHGTSSVILDHIIDIPPFNSNRAAGLLVLFGLLTRRSETERRLYRTESTYLPFELPTEHLNPRTIHEKGVAMEYVVGVIRHGGP